jgi:hypothetical protein
MRSNLSLARSAAFTALTALTTLATLSLIGCGGGNDFKLDFGNNNIGKPLASSSSLSDSTGGDRTEVVLFDKTVRLIHHFDLSHMSVINTLEVDHPDVPHTVLFDQTSGMIADFSDAHVTIFNRYGVPKIDPVDLTGHPKSAALDSALGLLVVYDDMNSVGLIELNSDGSPGLTWTGGPLLQNDSSITAGDLIDDGSLILALSDGSIAKVDVVQSISQRRWIFTSSATNLGHMKWVAPVHGFNDRVLVLSDSALSVVSLANGSVIAQHVIDASEQVAFESKIKDAHIVLQSGSQLSAVYTDGLAIHMRPLNLSTELVLSSRLSLNEDSWSLVTSKSTASWTYGSNEIETKDRFLRKFRFSDLASIKKLALPDEAQLDVAEIYIFALYPTSPLGFGERIAIQDGQRMPLKMFNAGHIAGH